MSKFRTPAPRVLPLYLIIDRSLSMSRGNPWLLDVVMEIVALLQEEIRSAAKLKTRVQIEVILFSDEAEVAYELGFLPDRPLPRVQVSGERTAYGKAFSKLADRIEKFLETADPMGFYAPYAIFFTDGEANDDEVLRMRAFNQLRGLASLSEKFSLSMVGIQEESTFPLDEYVINEGFDFSVQGNHTVVVAQIRAFLNGLVKTITTSMTRAIASERFPIAEGMKSSRVRSVIEEMVAGGPARYFCYTCGIPCSKSSCGLGHKATLRQSRGD